MKQEIKSMNCARCDKRFTYKMSYKPRTYCSRECSRKTTAEKRFKYSQLWKKSSED